MCACFFCGEFACSLSFLFQTEIVLPDLKKTEESPKRRSSLSKGIGVGQQRSSSQLLAGGYAFDDSFQPIAGRRAFWGDG